MRTRLLQSTSLLRYFCNARRRWKPRNYSSFPLLPKRKHPPTTHGAQHERPSQILLERHGYRHAYPLTNLISVTERRSVPESYSSVTIPCNLKCIIVTRRISRRIRSMSHIRRYASPLAQRPLPSSLPKPSRPRFVYQSGLFRAKLCCPTVMERVIGPFVASVCDLRDWWLQRRLARFKAERREKVQKWERISGKQEVGEYCLIDQMQLLTPRGWVHV